MLWVWFIAGNGACVSELISLVCMFNCLGMVCQQLTVYKQLVFDGGPYRVLTGEIHLNTPNADLLLTPDTVCVVH